MTLTEKKKRLKQRIELGVAAYVFSPSRGQPDLQSEFQNSQGSTEKLCLKKKNKTKTNKQIQNLKIKQIPQKYLERPYYIQFPSIHVTVLPFLIRSPKSQQAVHVPSSASLLIVHISGFTE